MGVEPIQAMPTRLSIWPVYQFQHSRKVVPLGRLELPRPFGQRILNPPRLPVPPRGPLMLVRTERVELPLGQAQPVPKTGASTNSAMLAIEKKPGAVFGTQIDWRRGPDLNRRKRDLQSRA